MSSKCLLTSIGEMTVQRRYYACGACRVTQTPLDAWAGIGRRMASEHARRVLCVAGASWSFEQASAKLAELCRLRVSNDTIRAVCDEEGERSDAWLRRDKTPGQVLDQAAGELEFSTDGMKINTTGGWCEMRLSVMNKRPSASPATPQQWADRTLPDPSARVAWCQIAPCRLIGARWQTMFKHLQIDRQAKLSVIADGAKWIWDQARRRLQTTDKHFVVDIYHVSQHLHDCAKQMLGEGPAAIAWVDQQRMLLMEHQGVWFVQHLRRLIEEEADASRQVALTKLLNYLTDNADRMWYATRLAQGRPIGSGLIEGACKTILGMRLKLNSARWVPRRAQRMGNLRCLQYSGLWDQYWNQRVA